MEIYLIRHTRVAVDTSVCYGQADVGLAETFEEEKEKLKNLLPNDFESVYASPLSRCARLAANFSEKVVFDERLKEYHFGEWELTPWAEIPEKELAPWMEDFVQIRPPQGETLQEMYDRVQGFITHLLDAEAGKVLVVAHGGVIRCFLRYVLEFPLKNAFRYQVNYGEYYHFSLTDKPAWNKIKAIVSSK